MFNRLLKITCVHGEQRWINLDLVTRISMSTDNAGEPVLAFCFDQHDRVLVHGTDDDSRALIRRIVSSLDAAADASCARKAA